MNVSKLALVALALVAQGAVAAPTPKTIRCTVLENGRYTASMPGDDYFAYVAEKSRAQHSCVVGKLYNVADSNRIYINGRLAGPKGMSNAEVANEKRALRLSCETLSCLNPAQVLGKAFGLKL